MKTIDYQVKSGEKLSSIARRYNIAEDKLSQLNGISGLNQPMAGQTLRIPVEDRLTQGSRTQAPKTDRVRAGEDLPKFAQRHNVTEEALRQANGLSASSLVAIGMSLNIPQESQPPSQSQTPGSPLSNSQKSASSTGPSPLATQVKEILKLKKIDKKRVSPEEKTTMLWEAFKQAYNTNTSDISREYQAAVTELINDSGTEHYTQTWAVKLLRQASASNVSNDKNSLASELLAKVVIIQSLDPAVRQIAYNTLSDEKKRQLLDEDNGAYEKVLFDAADELAALGDKLAFMKQLVRVRFNHITEIGPSPEKDSPDWESGALRRVYKVMKGMPAGHIVDNIKALHRAHPKQVGRSEDEQRVAGDFNPDTKSMCLRESPGSDMLNTSISTKINLFEFVVRHEIGHAVDHLLLEQQKQNLSEEEARLPVDCYSKLPNASEKNWKWKYYKIGHPWREKGMLEMIQEMMSKCESPHNAPPEPLDAKDFADVLFHVVHLLAGKKIETLYNDLLGRLAKKTGKTKEELLKKIKEHTVYKALINLKALDAPFQDGQNSLHTSIRLGDRVFVRSYPLQEFASFSAEAFPSRIRNYSVRGPAEWFADIYAIYHDPEGRKALGTNNPAAEHLKTLLAKLQTK